jgi:hypothetical protein
MLVTTRYSIEGGQISISLLIHGHKPHFWIIGQFKVNSLFVMRPNNFILYSAVRTSSDVYLAVFHHVRVHGQGITVSTELYRVYIAIKVRKYRKFSRFFRSEILQHLILFLWQGVLIEDVAHFAL